MANLQSTLPNDEKKAQDSAYNPGDQKYLEGMGGSSRESIDGYNRANDGLDDHPISSGDASGKDPQDSVAAVRKAEEYPDDTSLDGGLYKRSVDGGKQRTGQKNIFVKRGGIIGLVLTFIVGGGIAGIALLSPAGLFIQLGNVFSNAFDDSSSALNIRTNKLLSMKVEGLKNAFDQSSEGKCNIKCKFGTVGETMKNNLESPSNKFQAEFGERKFGGRYTLKSIRFPDGTKVTSGAEFTQAMKDPRRARDFSKVFNSKIKFFLNGSPFALALKNKLGGLDRSNKIKPGTQEEIDASLRETVGAEGATAAEGESKTIESKKAAVGDKLNAKVGAKVAKATDFVGVACLAYDVTRVSVAVTKATKIAAFAAFGFAFLSVKDQIMAGDADPSVVSALGAQLTDNGTSATDAPIYGQAARGDIGDNNTGFSLSPSTGFATALAGIGGVVGVNAVARGAAHELCKTGGGPVGTVVSCLPEIAAGFMAAGVGSIVAAVGCIGINVIGGALAGAAIGAALPTLLDAIAKGDLKIPDETTRGVAAGQVIGLAAEVALNGKSQSYGMTPASSADQIVAYNNATLGDKNQQTAIAKLDAADDPLNINNEYTFVGSLASKLDLASYKSGTFMSAITHTLGLLPMSLAGISSNIYAESGYPLGYDKSTVFKSGNDASLDGVGFLSDKNGLTTYVMSDAELAEGIGTAIDNLTSSNDINADGNAIPGSDFEKYTTYCGINRVDPMGETTGSISDDDYEWEIGAKCGEKSSHMNDIRVYTMDGGINDTIDGKYVSSSASGTPVAVDGKAIQPLQPGYSILSGFGPRTTLYASCLSVHSAVDLTKEITIANIAKDPKNIINASGYSYINPILYWAQFGVIIG